MSNYVAFQPVYLVDANEVVQGIVGPDDREWSFPAALAAGSEAGTTATNVSVLFDDSFTPMGYLVNGREFLFGAVFAANTQRGYRQQQRPTLVSAAGAPLGVRSGGKAWNFPTPPTELTTSIASAAVRMRRSAGDGTVIANNFNSTRIREKANAAVVNPWVEVWNGWVNAVISTGPQEVIAVDPCQYRMAFLTNLGASSGSTLVKTGTITPLTWRGAGTCRSGFIWKLDGTPGDLASFQANGGALSADGLQLTLPQGWYARTDSASGLVLSGEYMVQMEDGKATPGTSRRANFGLPQRADLGDANKPAGTSGTLVYSLDWTGAAQNTGAITTSPVAVFGISLAGVKTGATAGDSIETETGDFATGTTTLTGDADGCLAFANRALNTGNYCWVRTCIPGTRASLEYSFGGGAIRNLMMRHATWVITDMGHNDRGLTFTGAAPAGYKALHQWYWSSLRQVMKPGARVIATDLLPKTSSTDTWATTANQTDVTGASQYASINPFFQAGSFVLANGDCDAAYSIYTASQNSAVLTPLGYTDVAAQKYPTFGVANSGSRDGTHPGYGLLHQAIASQMAGSLATLIGY